MTNLVISKLVIASTMTLALALGACATDDGDCTGDACTGDLVDPTATQTPTDDDLAIACAAACSTLYECTSGIVDSAGAELDENGCFTACEAGGFTDEELTCLSSAPCGAVIKLCFDTDVEDI